jgi:hypothetical protein
MNATRLWSALAGLQLLAVEFSRTPTAMELGARLWVAFVPGADCPWRLVETERAVSGRSRRTRMLCFRLLDEIRLAVEERVAWATADEQFRATQMATPGGFPGVTADWVPAKTSIWSSPRRASCFASRSARRRRRRR